jgi:hypothetical protein
MKSRSSESFPALLISCVAISFCLALSSYGQSTEAPIKFELDRVPMVKQKGNFCVPASAAMIAGFHGIKTDQDQIAQLSSDASVNNQGTYPGDMVLAMKKLGFDGQPLFWSHAENFQTKVLPAIRESLLSRGPIYISFKPGVFGAMGHGCVIIGYDDRREELTFHNPWGNVFERKYDDVAHQAYGIVLIQAPLPSPIADQNFIERASEVVPRFEGDMIALSKHLAKHRIAHELVWCSRRDARVDKRFARDTARDEGRRILDLAFERHPAVLIPHSIDGETVKYQFVTRPPDGGARFLAREIDASGWGEPKQVTLGSLTRNWTTRFETSDGTELWELPMIELHPPD